MCPELRRLSQLDGDDIGTLRQWPLESVYQTATLYFLSFKYIHRLFKHMCRCVKNMSIGIKNKNQMTGYAT